jgi:hypothetical protein
MPHGRADESEADDGSVHRFWRFIEIERDEVAGRRTAEDGGGIDIDVDDPIQLLTAIIAFDRIQDFIEDVG